MAYGAQYIYDGMKSVGPNVRTAYDSMVADKRRREQEEEAYQRQLGLINADVEAEQTAGNRVLYAGREHQTRPINAGIPGGAQAMAPSAPSAMPTPVPQQIAEKNNPNLRLLGAGGLGAPTYGSATPDAPSPGQAYSKPVGPAAPFNPGDPNALKDVLLKYHTIHAQRKQERLQHMDKLDIAKEYTTLLKNQNYAERQLQRLNSAIRAAQGGNTQMLQEEVGTKYDLNDPSQFEAALEESIAAIAQLQADYKAYQYDRQALEGKRMELGVPALTNDFEAAQWFNRQQENAPRTPQTHSFTPSSQRQGK